MADAQLTRFESMTNVELRAELKRRGCPTSGNKKDLLAKLHVALQKEYEQSTLNYTVGYPQNETPVTYTNLPIHDQTSVQYPSVYNLPVMQNTHPVIPVPQQFVEHQQLSSMNTIPSVNSVSSTPEKKTRGRSKKPSVDSRTNEISNPTSIQQSIGNEEIVLDTSNNVEMKSFVSKSNEKVEENIEKIGEESHLAPVGSSSSAKSESIIKEIPLSDEQQRLNQSITINGNENSAIDLTNDDIQNQNETIDLSSKSVDLPSATTNPPETTTEDESSSINKESEKPVSQQARKPNRPQISSLMKGLNRSTSNKINLSSEFLKTLIPDINLAPESIVTDELDTEQNNDNNHESILETSIDNDLFSSDSMTIGELADQKQQTNRTVAMNTNIDDSVSRKKTNSLPTRFPSFESKTNNIVTDEPIRIKDVTATHEPLSEILYIRGLTRPFSLMQLKGLLSRYGTLIDGEFWLDKIKSQCFVTYNTLEEAQNAREALDGCRWPSTNPKTLSVRFGRQDEFEFSKTHDLPPDHMSTNSTNRVIEVEESNVISTTLVDRIESKNRSDELKPQSGFLIIDEEELAKTNDPSAKGLDDYFHKTKAKPSIYWLQLTDEQVIERTQRQEQRNAERDEEQKKRGTDDNGLRSEKRKRSSSPSRRGSKRY